MLLACLAWKQLEIGTYMLLIITTTSDELLNGVNIDDFEWPWTLNDKGSYVFFAIFGCGAHFSSELRRNKPGQAA